MCGDLAAWLAGRLATLGSHRWPRQSTRLALFGLLSPPGGPCADKPLVHLFLDSGRLEFLDKGGDESGSVMSPVVAERGSRLHAPHD